MKTSSLRLLCALAVAIVASVFGGAAQAHCRAGSEGSFMGVASTCSNNEQIETITGALSTASQGLLVHVFVKDQTFHPEVVHVKSGGTVVFHYLDIDRNETHDPRSSGLCATGTLDLADPSTCTPSDPGNCFEVILDQGASLKQLGDNYPVTFTLANGRVLASRGVLSGTPVIGAPPFTNPTRTCPLDTSYASSSSAVIPYHCGVHGAATTRVTWMRGAIVVDP